MGVSTEVAVSTEVGVFQANKLIGQVCCHSRPFRVAACYAVFEMFRESSSWSCTAWSCIDIYENENFPLAQLDVSGKIFIMVKETEQHILT